MRRGMTELTKAGDITKGRKRYWRTVGDRSAVCEIILAAADLVWLIDLRENIGRGQVVSRYTVEAAENASAHEWKVISRGTTIGYRKLDSVSPALVRRLRLTIETIAPLSEPPEVRAYAAALFSWDEQSPRQTRVSS